MTATPTPARLHAGFWAIALTFLTAMAFSTVPTPLYPLYMARDGFSTFVVTVVFAAYAAGVVASLLLAGHVSDWFGRRRVLIPALLLELLAAVLFLTGTSLPVLLLARFVTGLGVGMITATATAHLQELHAAHRPEASRRRFEVVSTAANSGGLGLGTLVAGLLAQYAPAPLRTPYLVFLVLLVLSVVAVALTPETVPPRVDRPAYRPQRIRAHGDRTRYLAAAAGAFASFAVFGVFTALAPSFVAGTLHHTSRALAGAVVFAVFGSAAVAQSLTGGLSGPARTALGLLAQAGGVLTLVAGMHAGSLAVFVAGGVVSGVGAGVLFKASVGAVAAMAAPAERGEALAGLFLVAYLGIGVPAVVLGVATALAGPVTVMTWFAGVLVLLLAAVALLSRERGPSRAPVTV
ncbi:MFS transporter [Actinoplanes rectilineatus]|uniref:MFS transporter n=1 Tax=Actinoplanes rectilineatus TaxID=113571 RepID=UPI001FE0C192|nr:MFS transporter [Actinoplanes rectilineatus]